MINFGLAKDSPAGPPMAVTFLQAKIPAQITPQLAQGSELGLAVDSETSLLLWH